MLRISPLFVQSNSDNYHFQILNLPGATSDGGDFNQNKGAMRASGPWSDLPLGTSDTNSCSLIHHLECTWVLICDHIKQTAPRQTTLQVPNLGLNCGQKWPSIWGPVQARKKQFVWVSCAITLDVQTFMSQLIGRLFGLRQIQSCIKEDQSKNGTTNLGLCCCNK